MVTQKRPMRFHNRNSWMYRTDNVELNIQKAPQRSRDGQEAGCWKVTSNSRYLMLLIIIDEVANTMKHRLIAAAQSADCENQSVISVDGGANEMHRIK